METNRKIKLNSATRNSLREEIFIDATSTDEDGSSFHNALCSKMTTFFRNHFAAPTDDVNDDLALWRLQQKMKKHCLGNFKDLAREMFSDLALGISLNKKDPTLNSKCHVEAPDENFAREWHERFTVGNSNHNIHDIQSMAKMLNPGCCAEYQQEFSDKGFWMEESGMIWSNKEAYCLDSRKKMDLISDRTLEFAKEGDAPAAAKFLCVKLFSEFTGVDLDLETSREIESCGRQLVDNDWMIPFALQYVFQHPLFYVNLGNKTRWLREVLFGAEIDLGSGLDSSNLGSWLTRVGQEPFGMPDVGGYVRQIQINHLMELHSFLRIKLYTGFKDQYPETEFEIEKDNMEKFDIDNKFQKFAKDDGQHYAFLAMSCPRTGILDANEGDKVQEMHQVTKDQVFAKKNAHTNMKNWIYTMRNSIDNPCMFVC